VLGDGIARIDDALHGDRVLRVQSATWFFIPSELSGRPFCNKLGPRDTLELTWGVLKPGGLPYRFKPEPLIS
jgi:hypothetical protein